MNKKGKLITISGSTGSGIGTVISALISNYENYKTVGVTTTRHRRIGETQGENYYFVNQAEFEKQMVEDQFIEYWFYAGNYYGIAKKNVFSQMNNGVNIVLETSHETAYKIKAQYSDTIQVSIVSADMNMTAQELKANEKSKELTENRLLRYKKEANIALEADVILVNYNSKETADYLAKIIENPEKEEVHDEKVELVIGMKKNIKEYFENNPRILLLHAESSKRLERLVGKLNDIGVRAIELDDNLASEKFNKDRFMQTIATEKNILFFISKKMVINKKTMDRFFYAWEYTKKRDKKVITIVEWESILVYNERLRRELASADLIFPEDGLHSEQDYIDIAGRVCDIVKREENRKLLYDKISSLIRISYVPGIVSNVSKLIADLCEEVEECENQLERISIYKEIWKWIEILDKNGEQGYGDIWRKTAHKRLDAMKCLSRLLKHEDFKQDNLYLIAYVIRALFVEIQIRDDCVDTITSGDIHGLRQETKVSYYEKQQQLVKKLNDGIVQKRLSKENQGSFTNDEIMLILNVEHRYMLTKTERVVNKVQKNDDSNIYEEDFRLTYVAEQLMQTNQIFRLISENRGTKEIFQCLKISYERLKKYSEIIGAKSICAECLERIAEINQRIDNLENLLNENTISESAFKALLGFKIPDSELFDVFISYKHEDADIAKNIYIYLKQNLLYPFLDSYTLPELSDSDYEDAIMDSLEKSKHFVVIISKLEYLKSFWVQLEMKTFQHESNEGRKGNANFLMIVSDEVAKQILETNKKCLNIRYRSCEIIKISEYKERILNYLID